MYHVSQAEASAAGAMEYTLLENVTGAAFFPAFDFFSECSILPGQCLLSHAIAMCGPGSDCHDNTTLQPGFVYIIYDTRIKFLAIYQTKFLITSISFGHVPPYTQ